MWLSDDVIIHVTITTIGITIDMTSETSSSSKVQFDKFTQEYCKSIRTFSSLPFVSAPMMYEPGEMQRQFVQGLVIAALVGTGNNTCKVLSLVGPRVVLLVEKTGSRKKAGLFLYWDTF